MPAITDQAIQLALFAGHVVATSRTTPPGVVLLIGMPTDPARLCDGIDRVAEGTLSLGLRPASHPERDCYADSRDERDDDNKDSQGHGSRSAPRTPRKLMAQPVLQFSVSSSP
jgi:hypothetical protein